MSTEEEQQLIGRLFLEHREMKQRVETLAARLRSVGHSVLTIAQQLKDGQFDTAASNLKLYRHDVVDLTALEALVNEHRAAKDRMEECARSLDSLK